MRTSVIRRLKPAPLTVCFATLDGEVQIHEFLIEADIHREEKTEDHSIHLSNKKYRILRGLYCF